MMDASQVVTGLPQNHKAALGVSLVPTMHRCHHCPLSPRSLELQNMPLPGKDVCFRGWGGRSGRMAASAPWPWHARWGQEPEAAGDAPKLGSRRGVGMMQRTQGSLTHIPVGV